MTTIRYEASCIRYFNEAGLHVGLCVFNLTLYLFIHTPNNNHILQLSRQINMQICKGIDYYYNPSLVNYTGSSLHLYCVKVDISDCIIY